MSSTNIKEIKIVSRNVPAVFLSLAHNVFYRGDRDIHLIGDFLIRKIPFQLIQTDLAFLLRQVIDRLVK